MEAQRDLPQTISDPPEALSVLLEGQSDLPEASNDLLEVPCDLPKAPNDLLEAPCDFPWAPQDPPQAPSDLNEALIHLHEDFTDILKVLSVLRAQLEVTLGL